MDLSTKSKVLKKRKKRKPRSFPSELQPLIKPELFDGISNWTRMQKFLGITSTEKLPQNSSKPEKPEISNSHDHKRTFKLNQNHLNTSHNLTPKQHHVHKTEHIKFKKKPEDFKESPNSKCQQENSKIAEKDNGFAYSSPPSTSNHLEETRKKSDSKEFVFNFSGRGSSTNQVSQPDSHLDSHTLDKNGIRLTKAVAMDCEMVGTGPTGKDSIIARVSIVNSFGELLYDEFVKPKEKITDYRTWISGVRPSDIVKGKELYEVQKDVLNILDGRILVGHSLKHDLDVLYISHPRPLIRDTSSYKPFRELSGGRTPSLKKLCSEILQVDIQSGEHSSAEDAQAAMLLYLNHKHRWEKHLKSLRKKRNVKKVSQNES